MQSETKKDEWSPRMWEGMDFFAWLRLLVRNRFAVHPRYWYIAAIITWISAGNTVLRWLQYGRFGERIADTPIPLHPIFVIGHWRTGTTLLHELMILDERFAYPDTYACLEPNHTLLTEHFVKRYMGWVVPSRRPMDNMAVGFDRPQEDEFALCMIGLPTPYTDFAFPNRPPLDPGALDLRGLSPPQRTRWKRGLRAFLQMLTFKDPRRLVLKSPPHTARIPVLLEMFPGARFLHIVRDPYVVFNSTLNLWKALARKHGLQVPRERAPLREKVFREFLAIYDNLEDAKSLIPAGRFHEVRYEELVNDPVGEMRKAYSGLELDGFEAYLPKLREYLARTAGYETNKYRISDADRAEVKQRWGNVIERYGYG